MPRVCTICSHPARENIDSALVCRLPYRYIAQRFDVSKDALSRHLNDHLAEYVQQALAKYGEEKGVKVLDKVAGNIDRLEAFLERAEAEENGHEFRANAAEMRKQLELLAKLQGELAQEGQVNIHMNAEWLELRVVILDALRPFPEARRSVMRAIEGASKNGS
jgi:hypothetical protein